MKGRFGEEIEMFPLAVHRCRGNYCFFGDNLTRDWAGEKEKAGTEISWKKIKKVAVKIDGHGGVFGSVWKYSR